MSIIRLRSDEIDPNSWNELVNHCKWSRIFSKYDYLKAVNPEFEAIVEIDNDKYLNAFPLMFKKRFGIMYLVQPVFTQQIQILSRESEAGEAFLNEICNVLGQSISMRLSLDSQSASLLQKNSHFQSSTRITYILNLGEHDFSQSFSKNHKRNIKAANKLNWTLDINNDFHALLSGFIKNKGRQIKISRDFLNAYDRLMPFFASDKYINIFSALDENGDRMASGLFAGYKDVMTFLLSFSNEKAKKAGIMHAIINEWLLNYSTGYKQLDFEGGNIASLGRFYSSFGAEKQEFVFLEKHRFPLAYLIKS